MISSNSSSIYLGVVVRIGNSRGRLAIGVFTLISGVLVRVLPAVVSF